MFDNSRPFCIFKLVICLSVVLFATIFLSIATYETLKFGPGVGTLTLRINFITLENLYVTTSKRLVASWNANLAFVNHRRNLQVTIPPFNAFLTYSEIPISCGFMNETLRISHEQEKTFNIRGTTTGCEWGRQFMLGTFAVNLTSDIEQKKVTMGIEMSVGAYYKHGCWGWDVMLKPSCENLSIELDHGTAQERLESIGGKACKVPQPLWYY